MLDVRPSPQGLFSGKVLNLVHCGLSTFYELHLEVPGFIGYQPGQFVMIRPKDWRVDPLLPRPFSIADLTDGVLKLFFQVVGKGTARLAALSKDDGVEVWGPLGHGFALNLGKPNLLLAGGMGIAPFVGLVRSAIDQASLSLIFGHRQPLSCYPFESLAKRVRAESHHQIKDEDIPAFLKVIEERMKAQKDGQILACGPEPFLRAIQEKALRLNMPTQLSLEKRMACGVGACLGCVVEKTGQGLVQSCTQGPVFFADEITL